LFYSPDFKLVIASNLSKQKRYEQSEILLCSIDRRNLRNPDSYSYFRLLNNFSLNKKIEAEKYSKELQDYLNTSLPERYKCLSYLMIEDLKQWKDGDLNSISRDMERIKTRLSNNQGGRTTQQIQKDVVSKLDLLIKDLEKKKEEIESKEEAKKKQDTENQGKVNPQEDSKPAQDVGPGNIDFKKLRKLSIEWGRLPPRERESNMKALLKDVPLRYKEVVNEYFRKQSQ